MARTSSRSVFHKKGLSRSLVKAATRSLRYSYAPYSHINVSAVVYCPGDTLYTGVNIENASYGLSMCAERVALYKAVSAGEREFPLLLVHSPQIEYIVPCGACLQVMAEFAPDIVIVAMNSEYKFKFLPLSTLLPRPFKHPGSVEKE